MQHEEDGEQEQEETVQPRATAAAGTGAATAAAAAAAGAGAAAARQGAEERCGEYVIQVLARPRFTVTRMRDLEVSCVASLGSFNAIVPAMALRCVFLT